MSEKPNSFLPSRALNRCLHTAFLEQCWQVNYSEFVTGYHALCDRTPLEKDPLWLIERCWQLERRSLYSSIPKIIRASIDTGTGREALVIK